MARTPKVILFHPKELSRVRTVKKQYDATYIHACNACPRRYKEIKYLNFHIKTMLRQKTYQCDECSETFYRKYHLGRHLGKSCSALSKKTTHKQNKELDKKAQDAGKKSYGPEAIGAETSTGKVVDNFAADISLSDDFDMEQISTIGI